MRGQWLMLLGASILLAILHHIIFNFNLHLYSSTATAAKLAGSDAAPQAPEFSVLIGIITRADLYDRRHFLRLVYGTRSSPIAEIHVRFVFCTLTKEEQRVLVALEILRFNDVIILNCTENMNSGKTYSFFSSLPATLSRRYDYVMKTDDDSFVHLPHLVASLRRLPRRDLYYGAAIPCAGTARDAYMSGMGFLVSWDIVEYIAAARIPAKETVGPEDRVFRNWLVAGGKGRRWYSARPAMYDYPGTNVGSCSHALVEETIIVHKLKTWDRWLHVIRFFNLTQDLKTSKLYHIY